MGLLKLDTHQHVIDFYEKPQDPEILKKFQLPNEEKYLGSMGIYVFKREALIQLLKEKGNDFGKDLIPIQIKKGKTAAFIYDGYWEDIGTVESYYRANLALTEHKNCLDLYDEKNTIYTCPHNLPSPLIKNTQINHSIISQGSVIEGAEVTNSVIGVRTHIKPGTVIRDSILIGNHYYKPPKHQSPPLPSHFQIGENCIIEKAIIDEESLIGNNVQLINKNHLQNYDGDGIFIRDGIIIVTSGTELPDNFVL
jgi:glucose-1-phosphate adenylyltransferase